MSGSSTQQQIPLTRDQEALLAMRTREQRLDDIVRKCIRFQNELMFDLLNAKEPRWTVTEAKQSIFEQENK